MTPIHETVAEASRRAVIGETSILKDEALRSRRFDLLLRQDLLQALKKVKQTGPEATASEKQRRWTKGMCKKQLQCEEQCSCQDDVHNG
jgi:invasion protein IalB